MITFVFLFLVASPDAGVPSPAHIRAAAAAYQAGKAALLKKQPLAAAELLTKAIEIEPTFLDAYEELINARIAAGDSLDAASVMTRLLEIEPAATHYRLLLGQILLAQKEWDRALAQYSFVLRDAPFDADALWGFATAAKQLGMEERAAEALTTGRSHYPRDKRFLRR